MSNITEAEIIDQIKQSLREKDSDTPNEHVKSMAELCEALGMTDKAARKHVRAMVNSGDVEVVWVRRRNMVGVVNKIPAYRYVTSS